MYAAELFILNSPDRAVDTGRVYQADYGLFTCENALDFVCEAPLF